MTRRNGDTETLDIKSAGELLETYWRAIVAEASAKPDVEYVADISLCQAIHDSVNHKQVRSSFWES
jgi:hypothetical protein